MHEARGVRAHDIQVDRHGSMHEHHMTFNPDLRQGHEIHLYVTGMLIPQLLGFLGDPSPFANTL